MTNAELEKVLHSDTATGLSEAEAARRLRRKKNTVWRLKGTSVKKYAAKSFMEFTTVLLIAAVITGAVFDGALGAVLVCVMLFACRAARIGAYIWAQRKLEKNAAEALPRARVVRGGSVRSIPADMIAPGDVIILDTGDTVPCDIRLTAADNLLVSEGTVTDNDGIVSKNSEPVAIGGEVPVTMRSNMLYATSAVISGFAVGIAVATGRDTLVCAREGEVVLSGGDDVPVLAKLADWSRICSLSLTAASLVITAAGVAVGHKTLAEAFVPAIAMAAACLSEYLGAVGAAAWAAALRPDSDGAVMRSAAAAECAANADILVLRSPAVMKSGKNTLHSYYKDSKLTMIGTKGAGIPYRLLSLACYCTGMSPRGSIAKGSFGKKTRHTGVLAYSVVRALWDENGDAKYDPNYTVVSHVAAGEENSGGLDNVLLARANDMFFAASGSVAKILPLCKTQRIGNEIVPLDADARRRISEFAAGLMQRGVTVCAVGFRRSHYNNLRRMSVLQSDLCFEGFFAVSQRLGKPRSSIANSLRLLKLPESVQGYISSGMISPGHAKVILGLEDRAQQEILARRIIENGLNVRGAEDAVRRLKDGAARADSSTPAAKAAQSAVVRDVQNKIALRLNASVELRHSAKKGKIIIEYLGNDDLQRILEIMGVKI